jgi:GrpB-like predicted nucleotidyltransferase (UPF0157 family)
LPTSPGNQKDETPLDDNRAAFFFALIAMSNEVVQFVPEESIRRLVDAAFEADRHKLLRLLTGADIQHVGATSVPGSLTKGDLDIQVRVPANEFVNAERVLAGYYPRNEGSIRTSEFSSFKNDHVQPHLGIQLTVIGGEFDFFYKLRDLLRSRSDLRDNFNALKQRFAGRAISEYRDAKANFIESLLASEPVVAPKP